MRNELVIYRDVFGGWRWEYFDADGEARDSPFGYDTRSECAADARRRGLLPHARPAQNAREKPLRERRAPVAFTRPVRPGEAAMAMGPAAPLTSAQIA